MSCHGMGTMCDIPRPAAQKCHDVTAVRSWLLCTVFMLHHTALPQSSSVIAKGGRGLSMTVCLKTALRSFPEGSRVFVA